KHGIRASVESYSIKKLEPLYKYQRLIPLSDVNKEIAKLQAYLELGDLSGITDQTKSAVQTYNRDDCISTCNLRGWLESIRSNLIDQGQVIERPVHDAGEASEAIDERQRKILDLIERLTTDIPADIQERSAEQQARWVLAYILD